MIKNPINKLESRIIYVESWILNWRIRINMQPAAVELRLQAAIYLEIGNQKPLSYDNTC